MEKRLLRKSNDKVIGGLCSGLAEYIGCNVVLVRLLTLFGILASGVFPGLLIYIICLVLIPLDTQMGPGYHEYYHPSDSNQTSYSGDNYGHDAPPSGNGRYFMGIGLIALGIFIFARMFFSWLDWKYVFAGLLILGGIFLIFGGRRNV